MWQMIPVLQLCTFFLISKMCAYEIPDQGGQEGYGRDLWSEEDLLC